MKAMRGFFQSGWRDRVVLLEAVVCLAGARLMIACLPFSRIRKMAGPSTDGAPLDRQRIERLGKLIRAASRHLPWSCECLVQALAGKIMLRRRRLPATIYFGVATGVGNDFRSHAWLCSGDCFVTGERGHEVFTVIDSLNREGI